MALQASLFRLFRLIARLLLDRRVDGVTSIPYSDCQVNGRVRFAHLCAPIALPSCADDVVSARFRCVIQQYRSSVLLADVDLDLIYVYLL